MNNSKTGVNSQHLLPMGKPAPKSFDYELIKTAKKTPLYWKPKLLELVKLLHQENTNECDDFCLIIFKNGELVFQNNSVLKAIELYSLACIKASGEMFEITLSCVYFDTNKVSILAVSSNEVER